MRLPFIIPALALVTFATVCFADYSVSNKGMWPESWPKELEGLRNRSRTLVGPMVENRHYAIPFTDREQFEKLWPHLFAVKTKDAPVILVKGPSFFLGKEAKAGVVVHTPPTGQESPDVPKSANNSPNYHERWLHSTYIELVVDGEIIDLNRINLSNVVVDERFKEQK